MDLRRLTEYAHSFIISKALFSSCELGIFDLLSQSEMPLSAASVAERLGTNTTGTERLLSACVGLKLLDMDIQNGEAAYKNTELSSLYLTKSSAKSLYPTFMFFSNEVYSLANNLTYAARSEEKMISFIHHTDSHWIMSGKEDVLSAFELSSFHTICDLGGGSGALAKDLSSVYPESRFIVFDLPIVVQTVQKYLALNDPRICFQQGGGVLISESILKEDRSGPVISEMFDIILLVCTEGKVRTASQYKSLLEAAGFKDIQFSIKGNLCETILAIK
ncbi:acetylserotonin O-methyltransferase-like [Rhinophrynus dorsalis]